MRKEREIVKVHLDALEALIGAASEMPYRQIGPQIQNILNSITSLNKHEHDTATSGDKTALDGADQQPDRHG